MNKKEKPLKIMFRSYGSRIFKGIAIKKFTDFLCGSLKKNIIVYTVLFFVVFMAIVAPGMINPKPVEAFAIPIMAVYVIAACLVGAIGGLIYQDITSASSVGETFYNTAPANIQEEITQYAEEGQTTGSYDVSNEMFYYAREWAQSKLTDDVPPINDFQVTGGLKVVSPWGSNVYQSFFDNDTFANAGSMTWDEYNSAEKYDVVYLSGLGIMCEWKWWLALGGHNDWRMWFNNTVFSDASWTKSGGKITNVYIDDVYDNTRYYWRYNTAADYSVVVSTDYNTQKPQFIFVKNETDGKTYFCATWINGASMTPYAIQLLYQYPGQVALPESTITDINAATIPGIRDDPDYDIVIDGHRPISYTDEYGNIIGLYPNDIVLGNWADAINNSIDVQTDTLKEYFDTYYPGWTSNFERLSDLADTFQFDATGALIVTSDAQAGSSTTFPELDLPQVDYNMPNLELLSNKFPFCIPFDFYNAIANLNTIPEAPVFDVNFPAEIYGGEADMSLDFGIFENLAKVIRWIILLGFVIGLILLTRRLIRG